MRFNKIYSENDICIVCNQSQQKVKKMCQPCYNRNRPTRLDTCKLCKEEKQIYIKDHCKTCYNKQRYMSSNPNLVSLLEDQYTNDNFYQKRTSTHCQDCGVLFNEKNKSAKNRCNSCYAKWALKRKSNICFSCGCELEKKLIRPICDPCKMRGNKRVEFRKKIPTEWELGQMKILMTKAKWGLLNEIDMFRVVHVYLLVVTHDESISSYSTQGVMQYCLRRFHEWVSLSKQNQ